MLDKLNEKLLTNFSLRVPEAHLTFVYLLRKMFYFFIYADIFQNTFYNHLAFDVMEGLIADYNKKTETKFNKNIPLFGLFLINCIESKFLYANMAKTFEKFDSNCVLLLSTEKCSIDDLLIALIYLTKRTSHEAVDQKFQDTMICLLNEKLDFETNQDLEGKFEINRMVKILFLISLLKESKNINQQQIGKLKDLAKTYYKYMSKSINEQKIEMTTTGYKFILDYAAQFDQNTPVIHEIHAVYSTSTILLEKVMLLDFFNNENPGDTAAAKKRKDELKSVFIKIDADTFSIIDCAEIGITYLYLEDERIKKQFDFMWILN